MFNKSNKEISLEECSKLLKIVEQSISDVIYRFGDEGDNVRYEQGNLDEEYLRNEYISLMEQLEKIYHRINYLSLPVSEQGFITHNKARRYELPSGTYFTSGSTCEILYDDKDFGEQYWVYTTIEHNGEDYYAKALGKDVSINGMMVRVRGK